MLYKKIDQTENNIILNKINTRLDNLIITIVREFNHFTLGCHTFDCTDVYEKWLIYKNWVCRNYFS